MICPQCKAEYRAGFTRCADCDMDLVEEGQGAVASTRIWEAELPEKWAAQLWRGCDPHTCLSLMGSLAAKRVPCLARSANPPVYDSFADQPPGSSSQVEFEIRVSPKDLSYAQWILRSSEELQDEEKPETEAETGAPEEELQNEEKFPDFVCPLCAAEFTTAQSMCPNCGVSLRLPRSGPVDRDVKLLTDLYQPQFLADLRMGLRRAAIPFNNANVPDGPDTSQRNILVVLDSDFDRANEVMAQVLQYWEFDRSFFLGPSHDPRESYWPRRAEDSGWYPEDLTLIIWSGTNLWTLDGVGMALREHEIAYRVEVMEPGSAKVFIYPDDEAHAREILRDILEARRAQRMGE
jgi:hypothetical protein